MLPAVPTLSWIIRGELPVAAAVAAAAMHTTAAAVETTTAAAETAGAAAAVETAGASVEAMISAAEAVVKAPASAKAATAEAPSLKAASLEAATAETASLKAATTKTASEKAAMEPRSGADKDATHKVVWTVVAIRRTRIWGIPVVAVGANWSGSYITGTNSNANGKLSVGVTCRKHQNAK